MKSKWKTLLKLFSPILILVALAIIYNICLCNWALYAVAGYFGLLLLVLVGGFIYSVTNTFRNR